MTTMGSAGTPESGAEFRKKFEDLQAAYNALSETTIGLAKRQFPLLQPGDFEGVEPGKFIETAEARQAARETERESIFAEMAAAKGIDVSALKQAPAKTAVAANDAANRIASIGELRGTPVAPPDNTQGLEGRSLLEAVYAAQGAND